MLNDYYTYEQDILNGVGLKFKGFTCHWVWTFGHIASQKGKSGSIID